jgi:putative membrane protein
MGFIIGSSMLVPGVSGGSMAIIVNVYDDLIDAVSNFRKRPLRNFILLACFAVGGLVGILLISGPLLKLVEWQPFICLYFFMGAIVGCIPPLIKKAFQRTVCEDAFEIDGIPIQGSFPAKGHDKIRPSGVIAVIIGLAIGISLQYLPSELIPTVGSRSLFTLLLLFFVGIIIAIALVLPGISASYLLLALGMYDVTLLAIKEMDFLYIVPIAFGGIVGIFATTKILDKSMKRHPQATFMLIVGFMIGSLYEIFPGLPSGIQIPISVASFIVGFLIILALGMFARPIED